MTGNGPINKIILDTYLKPVLDKDALLVSDGNPTYGAFCKAEKVSHEIVNISQGQRVTKGAYHIQNVNAYHHRFKSWLALPFTHKSRADNSLSIPKLIPFAH